MTLLFQLFADADIPYDQSVESPAAAPPVNLGPVYSLGLRMMFDRCYDYQRQSWRPVLRSDASLVRDSMVAAILFSGSPNAFSDNRCMHV